MKVFVFMKLLISKDLILSSPPRCRENFVNFFYFEQFLREYVQAKKVQTDTEYDDLSVIKQAFIVPLPGLSFKLILFGIPLDCKNTVFCRRNNFDLPSEKKEKN